MLRLYQSNGVPLRLTVGSSPMPLKLFTHQLKALRFLRQCDVQYQQDPTYTRGVHGAITVLQMGLGKTLMAIAFALMLPNRRVPSSPPGAAIPVFPTLVIASKTVMTMWQIDGFEKFFPSHRLRILYLHKNWMTRDAIDALTRAEIQTYDFVVTTYDVILHLGRIHPETLDGVLEYGREGVWGENSNAVKEIHLRTRQGADRPEWTGLRVLYGTPWKLVIADESQRFANPKTKTFRAMMGIYGARKLCLTGTPIRNYKTDLWSQLRWMGYQGVSKPQHWRPMYMRLHNLDTCILSINYQDTDIVMPPQTATKHHLTLTPFENRVYQFIFKKAQEALDQMLRRKLNFVCVLALFTRLRQVCIAPYLITTMSKRNRGGPSTSATYAEEVLAELEADGPLWTQIKDRNGPAGVHSSKIQTIVHTIRALPPGDKVLVFSMFTSVLDLVASALDGPEDTRGDDSSSSSNSSPVASATLFDDDMPPPWRAPPPAPHPSSAECTPIGYEQLDGGTADRVGTMHRFKTDPACKVLLITYSVGGEGLNITEANHVILVEPWWTYAVPMQAAARVWRPGQTKPVVIHDLIATSTIEEHVIEICEQKKAMAATFLLNTTVLGETVTQTSNSMGVAMLRRILRT